MPTSAWDDIEQYIEGHSLRTQNVRQGNPVSKVVIIYGVGRKISYNCPQWLKWGGGQGAQPPAPIWAPCNSMNPWLNLQSVILCLNSAKLMGLEWVWGLLQPGFVRWATAPLLHKTTLTTDCHYPVMVKLPFKNIVPLSWSGSRPNSNQLLLDYTSHTSKNVIKIRRQLFQLSRGQKKQTHKGKKTWHHNWQM